MKSIIQTGISISLLLLIATLPIHGQIISQYVETDSGTSPKGIEIWNNTGSPLDFSGQTLDILQGTNGGSPVSVFSLNTGTLSIGEVIVIGTSDMESITISNGSTYYSEPFQFNGDDALVVQYGGTTTDVFGTPGSDPGSSWSGNGVSTANQNIELLTGIFSGDLDGWTDPSERFQTVSTTPSASGGLAGFGIAPVAPATPVITVSPGALEDFAYALGSGPSTSQSMNVSGVELTDDILITPSTSYEISLDNSAFQSTGITLFQSGGSVNSTPVYVRLKAGLGAGTYSENIEISSAGATSQFVACNGYVTSGEPSNHPTGFSASADSFTEITVSWTDADPAAEGYLLKGSDVNYGDITVPQDGIPEINDFLVQNVAPGVEIYQFIDLTPSTNYYFKIYPYNGSNASINYKTDGTVPQDEATTGDPPASPAVFFSEYIEGSGNNKAIEVYNGSGSDIDLSDFTVKLASNGNPWGNAITLSGILTAGDVYVIYNASADPAIQAVGDITSDVTFFNGNDALGLFYSTLLIDVIGIEGEDPGNGWNVAGITEATEEHTLIRKTSITAGNTDWISSAGTDASNSEWIVKEQNYFTNLGFGGTVWNGASDSDWDNGGNWDAEVPIASGNALIPDVSGTKAPSPVINGFANCFQLTVSSGATLEIAASGALTVYGSFTSNGSVIVRSDAIGNGSLIEPSGIHATVEAYVPASDWHFIGSPIDDPNTGIFTGHFLKWWDEISGTWQWVVSSDSTLAMDLQGYSVWPQSDATFLFTGTVNAGNRSISVTNSPASAFEWPGYNLIGNPYPSGIDWEGPGWTKSNIDNAIYAWNGSQYGAYVNGFSVNGLTNQLPPHQGFFIHCGTGGATLSISDATRIHTTQNNLKSESIFESLQLTVSGMDGQDETVIYFSDEASTGFDSQLDAYKLQGSEASPQFYTRSEEGHQLAIHAIPVIPQNAVNLSFEAGIDGIFELYLASINGLDGIPIFLEDKKEHIVVNLKSNPHYKFHANAQDDPARFKLHFSYNEMPGANEGTGSEDMLVFSKGQEVVIASENELSGNVMVFDLMGRKVASVKMNNLRYLTIGLDVETGYYIVSILTDSQLINRKIHIK
ncbi:MAG: lamin tail domain-containing protein [Bacteroidetes bacterium]|nr:lamin tail domain-containing protein [Bacteroidota bacterium]